MMILMIEIDMKMTRKSLIYRLDIFKLTRICNLGIFKYHGYAHHKFVLSPEN